MSYKYKSNQKESERKLRNSLFSSLLFTYTEKNSIKRKKKTKNETIDGKIEDKRVS